MNLFSFLKKSAVPANAPMRYGITNSIFAKGYSGRASLDDLYYFYNNVVDIKRAIGKIQDTVVNGGVSYYNKQNEEAKVNLANVSKIKSILEYSNEDKLYTDTVMDLNIAGNCYWLMLKNANGVVIGLQRLDPRTVSLFVNENGDVVMYVQSVNGVKKAYDEKDIIHIVKDTSTYNEILGISPIEAIIKEAMTEIKSQDTNVSFYENGGVPSYLYILEENLNTEQYQALKEEIEKNYKGADKKFKSGIIPFVKDIKTVTLSQREAEYVATRTMSTQKIVVAFGVDKFLLGYTDAVQRGNSADIRQEFYDSTVRSYEFIFEQVMNRTLLPRLGINDIVYRINKSSFSTNIALIDSSRNDVINGVITINEARRIRGLEPSDNDLADELLIGGMLLDDLVFDQTAQVKEVKAKLEKKTAVIDNLLR